VNMFVWCGMLLLLLLLLLLDVDAMGDDAYATDAAVTAVLVGDASCSVCFALFVERALLLLSRRFFFCLPIDASGETVVEAFIMMMSSTPTTVASFDAAG
jgi:hypothetical protein